MGLIAELKRRKVFRVAAVYAVVAWLILQVVDVVKEPLRLPVWFDTVAILLLAIGFPIAIILSWAFDLGPDGISRSQTTDHAPLHGRGKLEVALLALVVLGIGWLIVQDSGLMSDGTNAQNRVPVVVLMDTFAPRGVYDQETRDNSGTNADVLSDILRDLPIVTQKEAIGSTWDREDQLLKQNPTLILIHRSGFFHSMNLELRFGYPSDPNTFDAERWAQLYEFADNKLVAVLGFVGMGNPNTRFVVYSRGTGGAWPDPDYRAAWVKRLEGRFPSLKGRVTTLVVSGGTGAASFREPATSQAVRRQVQSLLGTGA